MDGYDKLKPFGVAISASVDGFSSKVMCGSAVAAEVMIRDHCKILYAVGITAKWHNGSHSSVL